MEKKNYKKLTYILVVITRKMNNVKRKQLLKKHINSNNKKNWKKKTYQTGQYRKKIRNASKKKKKWLKIEIYSCTMKKNDRGRKKKGNDTKKNMIV